MSAFNRVNSSSSGAASRVSGSGDDASTTYTKASSPSSQSPSARSQQRTVLSDKYQIGEELGRGAYGVVFKGIDTRTGEGVAIKQLSLAGISADTLHSIMGEIDLLKNLNHKNIVKYIGSFKTRTHLYIILEFMDNGALSNVIKPTKYGAFPESLVAIYIAQVLQGLAYLHDQGVVHRDIKGANILTTTEGLVKLADFGVAARLSELEADRDKSRLSVVGTPYWMAPEVIEMTSTTPASDIWSVACLAIELLTGQPPYFDLQPMSALFRIVQDEGPELPPDLSADMTDFLQICFQKEPHRRPSARALLKHRWITYNRQTLRSSWSRTQGMKSRGQKTDAHVSVSTVVERILQAEADEFAASAAAAAAGKPLPAQPEATAKGPPQIPMNQSRVALAESRGGSLDRPPQAAQEAASPGPAQPPPAQVEVAAEFAAQPLQAVQASAEQGQLRPELLPERAAYESRASSRANSLRLQSQQRGLLEQLFRYGGPGIQEGGEDLATWLEFKERNHVSDNVLPDPKLGAEDIVDGAVSKHQEAAEVRRLVAALRTAYGRPKGSRDGDPTNALRTATAIEASHSLLAIWRADSERIEAFLAEDGGVVIVELLQEPCSEQVALHVLQLLNELVAMDMKALGTVALLSVVPAVAQYAAGRGPPEIVRTSDLRLQAALFLQHLAKMNLVTAQLLITCQGLPVLVGLVESNFKDHGPLVHIGVNCIWRLLELHGTLSMNQICRLLAAAGIAHNLVHALKSVTAQAWLLESKKPSGVKQGRIASRPDTAAGADPQITERTASHAQAAARTTREELASNLRGPGAKWSTSYGELDATEGLHALLDKMGNLLLVLSHADTAVKATLCRTDTLKTLFSAIEYAPETLQLTALKAIKYLTTDPSMLEALQEAGTIEALGRYLKASLSLSIQVEALHALHNLCKISRARQEGAAKAGLVPYLMNLAQMSPRKVETEPLQEQLRQMAVSLLCGMAHSTQLTRSYLWTNNGLHTLLDLLEEEDWQGPALDALAAWLAEDPGRIEPRLTQRQPVEKFVQLFTSYSTRGGSDALARLLEPFLRILRRSPQITVEVAVAGLAGLVVEMLRTASALTALSLLQMVKVIYEHHPRPKEFVAKYAITDQLRDLSKQHGNNTSVLVKKQATHLLHAFQINSIF